MFCVKEFNEHGKFIGSTPFLDNIAAIELAKKIPGAMVTEIDHDEEGYVFEIRVWPPYGQA